VGLDSKILGFDGFTFSLIASCKSFTTSSLTTPEQLKPFVHPVNRADERLSCLQGNENVKPK